MKKSEMKRCETLATKGLDFLESIILKRDETMRVNQRTTWVGEDDAMHFAITFATDLTDFGSTDAELIFANLQMFGGFDDMEASLEHDNKEIFVSGIVGGKPVPKKRQEDYRHKELTVSDLVKFIKDHPDAFPNGLKTKISLGDYEGNTYCRKATLGLDDGRLYISHELHGDTEI